MTNSEFPNNVILENIRAILRPLENSDFENLKVFSLTELGGHWEVLKISLRTK